MGNVYTHMAVFSQNGDMAMCMAKTKYSEVEYSEVRLPIIWGSSCVSTYRCVEKHSGLLIFRYTCVTELEILQGYLILILRRTENDKLRE